MALEAADAVVGAHSDEEKLGTRERILDMEGGLLGCGEAPFDCGCRPVQPRVRGVGVGCRDGLVAQPAAYALGGEIVLLSSLVRSRAARNDRVGTWLMMVTIAESTLAPENTSNACSRNSDS